MKRKMVSPFRFVKPRFVVVVVAERDIPGFLCIDCTNQSGLSQNENYSNYQYREE
jgi:hypothetical protein